MTTRSYFAARIAADKERAKEDDLPAQRAECTWCVWLKMGLDTRVPNKSAAACDGHRAIQEAYSRAIYDEPIESSWQERQSRFINQAKEVYEAKQRRAA